MIASTMQSSKSAGLPTATAFQSSLSRIPRRRPRLTHAGITSPLVKRQPPIHPPSRRISQTPHLAWLSGDALLDSTVLAAAHQFSSHVHSAKGPAARIIASARARGIRYVHAHISYAASFVSLFISSGLQLHLVQSHVQCTAPLAMAGAVAAGAAPASVIREARGDAIKRFATDDTGKLEEIEERDPRSSWDRLVAWLIRVYLPQGFPHTTTPDYISFTKYRTLQNLASAIMSVISTEALLFGLGLGKKVAAGAAATSWVLKDGASYVVKILYGSFFGSKFDDDPKSWRIAADVVEDMAGATEIIIPILPMAYFLPLASLAMCLRGMSLMTGTATRHVVYRSLAASGMQNTGDIATKGESQGVSCKMLGLASGILLTSRIGQNYYALLAAYSALAGIHILANWRSVQCIQFSFFNKQRASILIESHIKGEQLPSPYDVSHSERIIMPPWRGFEPNVKIGVRVAEAVPNMQKLQEALHMFKGERFLIFTEDNKACIMLRTDSTPTDALRAYYVIKKYLYSDGFGEVNLKDSYVFMKRNIKAFQRSASEAGWDMRHMLLTDSQIRASW